MDKFPLGGQALVAAIRAADKAEAELEERIRFERDQATAAIILEDVYNWLSGAIRCCNSHVYAWKKHRRQFTIYGTSAKDPHSGLTPGAATAIAEVLQSKGLSCTIKHGSSGFSFDGQRSVEVECTVPGL